MLERVWCLAKKANIGDVYVALWQKDKGFINEKISYIFTRKNLKVEQMIYNT